MISQPSLEGNAKVIDDARPDGQPISPNVPKDTSMGIIIGLLIPIVFYVLRRLFDTQVKTYADVEKTTTVPFLCEIPALEDNETRNIVITDQEHGSVAESFRLLRAKTEFLSGEPDKAKVLLFSSLVPASGKTFISSNLAASIALAGKKVLVVDLDLRKGSLTHKL